MSSEMKKDVAPCVRKKSYREDLPSSCQGDHPSSYQEDHPSSYQGDLPYLNTHTACNKESIIYRNLEERYMKLV
jgi:hypothetical protein